MDQKTSNTRSGPGRAAAVALVLFSALFGAALMWFVVQTHVNTSHESQLHELQSQLLKTNGELAALASQRDMIESQLAVESSTRRGLEITLQAVQAELGASRDQMAFFEELLPPGPVGSVSIRGLDIQRKGRTLQYKVLLMRRGTSAKSFKGALQFQANGRLDGQAATVLLHPVQSMGEIGQPADPDIRILELDFDQFQRSGGLLDIPEGFEPDEVTLNVLEGNILRVSRTVELSQPPANG